MEARKTHYSAFGFLVRAGRCFCDGCSFYLRIGGIRDGRIGEMGQIPPHNLDAEVSVLGSVLIDGDLFERIYAELAAEAFFHAGNRTIWQSMAGLHQRGQAIDLVSVSNELRLAGKLEQVGGMNYLIGLSDHSYGVHAHHYSRIVWEKYMLRRLIESAAASMTRAFEEDGSLKDILQFASKEMVSVALAGSRTDFRSMRELVNESFAFIADITENGGKTLGVRCGFKELDSMVGGLPPGSLNIIAARPSMGKTALALSIAQHVATKEGAAVAVFSLEMSSVQLVARMLCSEARVDMKQMFEGNLKDYEYSRLAEVAGRLEGSSIFIDESSELTISELRRRARRLHAQKKLGLVVVDYLQLMSGPAALRGGGENRQQEIAVISRGLKNLARELEVPVLALSQLSRGVESRPNKRPMLSDLRESGSIEQDADLVMFIYRDEYYNKNSEKTGVAEVIIGKQRNGPVGTVELQFHGAHVRFNDLAKDGY